MEKQVEAEDEDVIEVAEVSYSEMEAKAESANDDAEAEDHVGTERKWLKGCRTAAANVEVGLKLMLMLLLQLFVLGLLTGRRLDMRGCAAEIERA
ncbi:hypothetical protein ACTXT7_006833 [Hymenolepis weldensis]